MADTRYACERRDGYTGIERSGSKFLVLDLRNHVSYNSQQKELKLLPIGAVAIPLDGSPLTNAHAFCFLETSIETCKISHAFVNLLADLWLVLPIPVHAFFRLMQQRRALEDADFPSWNPNLCTLVLAPLYVDALLRIASEKYCKMSLEQFYALWPEAKTVQHPWVDLVDAFYQRILPSHRLIGSPNGFITLKEAIFPALGCPQVMTISFVLFSCAKIHVAGVERVH